MDLERVGESFVEKGCLCGFAVKPRGVENQVVGYSELGDVCDEA